MQQGRVLRAQGGYFFVHHSAQDKVYQSKIRGRLQQDDIEVIAGDQVKFSILTDGTAVIEQRLARDNSLFRPPIANVDHIVVVVAVCNPKLNFKLLDKLLILAQAAKLKITICVNKVDLGDLKKAKEMMQPYQSLDYDLVYTSVAEKIGLEDLQRQLQNRVSVFAGSSGVGKSSLLNALQPGFELRTGQVSAKTKQGRHTTRRVELLPLDFGGWVADTPGFNVLDISFIGSRELQYFFPEMKEYLHQCKFSSCSHSHEPECAVKEAVADGQIAQHRYDHYLEFLATIKKEEAQDWRR
ncbi:ribosome small subunit-dependent GTPase A [Halanaerobaculum tunisiense]